MTADPRPAHNCGIGHEPMPPDLSLPPAIEAVIQDFDGSKTPFTELDVQQAPSMARASLPTPSDGDNFGAWAEVLAFSLAGTGTQASPWSTFFGPMGSGTDKDGNTAYFPDIAGADARVVAHWIGRAKTVSHPVLKARYADLACVTVTRPYLPILAQCHATPKARICEEASPTQSTTGHSKIYNSSLTNILPSCKRSPVSALTGPLFEK